MVSGKSSLENLAQIIEKNMKAKFKDKENV